MDNRTATDRYARFQRAQAHEAGRRYHQAWRAYEGAGALKSAANMRQRALAGASTMRLF